MIQPTPGSWGIEYGTDTLWVGPMRRDEQKVSAVVVDVEYHPDLKPEARAEKLANALLIAASPDMREALNTCLSVFESIHIQEDDRGIVEIAMAIAKLALSKASQQEGRGDV
jgi:hypothetical protein